MLGGPDRGSLRWAPLLMVLGVVGSAACSSTAVGPDAGGDAAVLTTTVDGCSWPAALAGTDSSSGQCRLASRAVLSCTSTSGSADCVTNASECDTSNTNITGPFTCQNRCSASEFGIECGFVGPGQPEVTPPPSCRTALNTPSGVSFYCCPCGS